MTPDDLATLHAACFVTPRPFKALEFQQLLDMPACFLCAEPGGFALGRTIAEEAELLTIAVDPAERRNGLGRRLLLAFEERAVRRHATAAFLEVAADNTAARALYAGVGYAESGRRPGYYRTPDGQRIDAVIMQKALGPG